MEKELKIKELATKVELLIQYSTSLIEDKELIKECYDNCNSRSSFVESALPVFQALGIDTDSKMMDIKVQGKRAKALYEFLTVLVETEKERTEFRQNQTYINSHKTNTQKHFRVMKPQTNRQKLLLFEAVPENLRGKTCGKCENCYRHKWDLSYFYCNARTSNRTGNGSLKVKHRQQACHLFKEKTKAIGNG